MIRPRVIATLFRKDMVDAIRETRVLVSLITPIILAVLYNTLFPENKVFEAKVAYAGPETSAMVQMLKTRAETGQSVDLKLRHVATKEEALSLVTSKAVDVAFVLPDDVDDAIRAGRAPTITLIQPEIVNSSAASWVDSSLQIGARTLANQKPPATFAQENVRTSGSSDQGVVSQMGTRRYFVLATVVMMLGMIAVIAVPVMLTEEVEKKTLDALLLAGSYFEVIASKALVGLAYSGLSVTLMLGLTRLRPDDLVAFTASTTILALALIGVGLLVGGLFKSAQQAYTWSSVLVLPVIGPAFVVGLPLPDTLDAVVKTLPTGQGMRLMANGLAGRALFGDAWLSYVVLGVWIAAMYSLLTWRLARSES